jgi:hypothetical protein
MRGRLLLLAALLAIGGCNRKPELTPLVRLETYSFDAASPLESRITEIPAELLSFYASEDKRPDYAAHRPSAADKALVMTYLRLLPPVYERVFAKRCVGVYFVEGLIGNGITSWVAGPDDKIYFHITLNPASLKQNISETMTERERSCFKPRPGWDVTVNSGHKYKGLLYGLAHEAAHGLDYVAGVSPYTDDSMPAYYWPDNQLSGGFFFDLWADYRRAHLLGDFPGRDRITFYGLGGGPKLEITEARELYQGLAASGFASLYGARSWAEDLAELETFYTLTAGLDQPVRVTLSSPDGGKYSLSTMNSNALGRALQLRSFMEKINDAAL